MTTDVFESAVPPSVAPPRSRRLSKRFGEAVAGYALVAAPAAVLFGLILSPAVLAVIDTFTIVTPAGRTFGLDRYAAFFADGYSRANFIYTLNQTILATSATLVVSFAIAVFLRFGSGRVARTVQALALFPLFVPAIVAAYALTRFLGPNGLFQILLEQVGIRGFVSPYLTPVGPFIGFVWEAIPLPVLILTAGFAQVSSHAVEAARDLGAGPLRILHEILIPQAKRSLLVAFSLCFLGIFGSFTIPYALGPAAPEMMGVFMQRTYGQLLKPDEAQVQAVICFMACAVVGFLYVRLVATSKG